MPADRQSGMLEAFEALGLPGQSALEAVPGYREGARILHGDRGGAREPRLRHRRRGLQGRPARLAEPARLRRPRAALGDRLQIPRRAGQDRRARYRYSGRPHRGADAGRQAGAGDGRWRRGVQRHAAQRGRDRAQGYPDRRYGGDPARRRRDPAGRRGREGSPAQTRQAVRVPDRLPGLRQPCRAGRGRGGAALHRRSDLRGPIGRAIEALRVAAMPSISRVWARSRSRPSSTTG